MACNSDHMEPRLREIESREIIEMLSSVGLYKGDAPYYGDTPLLDDHTSQLCLFCQENDLTGYSLEIQIWWRDHQKADIARIKKEIDRVKDDQDRDKAISKLTEHERQLLGIKGE